MKKNFLTSLLFCIMMMLGVQNAWAADKFVAKYSFDNAENPALTPASNVKFDYSGESVITSTKFLNLWSKENAATGDNVVPLTDQDLSDKTWKLTFYWAAMGGGNARAGYIKLKAGETELFNIVEPANGGKMTLNYGESSKEFSVAGMNKTYRFTERTKEAYNNTSQWYLFTIEGNPTDGVKMTMANANTPATTVVDGVTLSETNLAPTNLILKLGSITSYGIDELNYTYYTDEAVANEPIVSLTNVAGANRIYTAKIGEGETLHYIVPGGEEQTSTTTTTEITATESGDLVLWTTNGAAESNHITLPVTTGAVSLADIKFTLNNLAAGFEKTFTVSIDNSDVLLKPTATITYDFVPAGDGTAINGATVNGAITATEAGTYTFTASAEGYTSTTLTFENVELESVKAVDVIALDPTTVSSNWVKYAEQKVVGSSNQWAGKGFADPRDAYWYNFASESATATDILEGLTVEFDETGKTPQIFTGLGMMYPVHVLGADGVEAASPALTTGNIGIADPEGKYAVISYHPGYGTSVSTLVLTGDETWAMNRFDKAITQYEIFSIKKAPFNPSTAIGNADFTADEPIAQKVCTYAKDVQEGQVAQMQPLTGWTIVENGDARAAGTFAYGSTAILGGDGGNVPATGPNGETEGKVLGLEAVWSATTQYTQEVTLPAGEYLFEAVIYNAAGTAALSQNLIGIDGTYCTTKNYPVGKWTKDQVKITLAEGKTVTVSLGVNSGNVGNGAAPHLFIDHVKLYGSEEIAAIELAAAKENALAEVDALTIGDVLFTYPEAAITTAKGTIESATTVDEVNAALATAKAAQSKPAADKAYAIANTTATGNLCITTEKVSVAKDASVFFTEVEGGYILSNKAGEYILKTAGNTWTLSTTTTKEEAYVVNFNLADGAYTIQGANGLFGLDSTDEGSIVYANKAQSNNGLWTIAEYVAPVVEPVDVTNLIVNPAYLAQNEAGNAASYEGWTYTDNGWKPRNYEAPMNLITYSGNCEFHVSQAIANVPAGLYKLTVNAFYRAGSLDDERAKVAAGTELEKALAFYATTSEENTYTKKVMNISEGAADAQVEGNGLEFSEGKYVPDGASDSRIWYIAGKYTNELLFNVFADGATVTIGLDKEVGLPSDYCPIGAWKLYRLGDADAEAATPDAKPEPTPEPIEGIIYSWESPEGTPAEFGGTIAYVNGDGDRLNYAQGGYHTICLNGKKANIDDETASANAGKMVITLDKAVAEGDTIAYTAFINKNETKEASPYIVFENGTTAEGEIFGDEANIDATFNGAPTLKYTIVPAEAAGSKTITLTRSKTGTNLFITKLQIIEKKAEPEPEPTFFEFNGVAYIIDAETGKFVAAGHDYGTRGIISEIGLDLTFTANAETKMVTIDTKVKNNDTDHFLGSNLYMDAPAAEWGLLEQEFGFYITDGTKYLSIDANDNLALSEEPRLWILVTPEGVKNQILDDMKEASVEEPMDVTALIKANNFNRNDQRNAEAWTVSADCTNKNLSGGNGVNNCVESFHSTFTISQAIEGAPKGVYALTAQGFYRQDGSDNDHLPVFFANEETKTFPVKSGSENSMSDASGSFTNGLYTIDPIFVQVAEAGTLTVGAKLEGNTALWCIWDNFQLTYYGADADIDAVKNAAIIKELADLRAKALGLKEQIDVEAVKNAIDEAIATTADVTGAEAINTAIATVKAVIEKAEFYLTAKTALASMENVMAGTNVYTAEAFQTYNGIYEAAKGKYEAGELTAEDKLENPESLLGWHVANNVDDLLLSAWTIGETQCKDYDAGMYINTWSVEGENDGSNFKVPFFEYWTADANSLAENTLTATMTNLPEGKYDVTAWVRVRAKNGYTAPAYGITLSANEGEAVDVAAGDQVGTSQMYLKEFTAIGEVAADGVLKIQFKVAADNNISWLSFKNVKFVKQDVINDDDPEIEVAEGWRSIISNGNLASDEVANFFIKENAGDPVPAVIVPGAGKNNSRGIVINTPDNPSEDWDAQFFIQANENIPAGYKIHVEFDYKATQEAAFDTQSHAEPGNYIHWYCVDSYTATTEWQHMSKEVEVSAATQDGNGNWNGEWGKACDASEGGKPFKTIAFNLSKVKTATTFYFDNIAFWVSKVSTGITDVKNEKKAETIYNLRGQKVNKADKGLFIINGKKVVK